MTVSRARVVTGRPDRYLKQLSEHLGRRNAPVTEPGGVRLVFSRGTCLMTPAVDHLLLTATAGDEESLTAVEDVVARHLARIGRRDALTVEWVRDQGLSPDTEP